MGLGKSMGSLKLGQWLGLGLGLDTSCHRLGIVLGLRLELELIQGLGIELKPGIVNKVKF